MLLYWREKEEFLSLFKAWSWSDNDLKISLFEELLNIVNKDNIEELEQVLINSEKVKDYNDLPTQYRIYWQSLKDFITEEE